MRLVRLGTLCAAMIAFSAGTAAARTYITLGWEATTLAQDACLDQAEKSIRAGSFNALPHTQRSRHGVRGDYTVLIQCATDKNVVIFSVAGPGRELTQKYYDEVAKHF